MSCRKKTNSPWRARKVQKFLSQPFHVAEQFTGIPGALVTIEETIRGFREIVDGKHDDIPEQAFYMKGTIDEVVEAAKKMWGEFAVYSSRFAVAGALLTVNCEL